VNAEVSMPTASGFGGTTGEMSDQPLSCSKCHCMELEKVLCSEVEILKRRKLLSVWKRRSQELHYEADEKKSLDVKHVTQIWKVHSSERYAGGREV